jgi:hypothetical protein
MWWYSSAPNDQFFDSTNHSAGDRRKKHFDYAAVSDPISIIRARSYGFCGLNSIMSLAANID